MQTKENIAHSRTRPTQSGRGVSQGLRGVRQAAQDRKQERFTALLHHLTVDLLRTSFFALQRKAAPGIDGVTWQEYATGLEDRLTDLHGRVQRGAVPGATLTESLHPEGRRAAAPVGRRGPGRQVSLGAAPAAATGWESARQKWTESSAPFPEAQ